MSIEGAEASDTINDVGLVVVAVTGGFFGNVPDEIRIGLVAFYDVVEVAVVGRRFSIRPGNLLVPNVDHDVGDDALLIEMLDDPVEALEKLQMERAEVGFGIVASVRKNAGFTVVVFGRKLRVARPVYVVGENVHHDLIETVFAHVADDTARFRDVFAVLGIEGEQPVQFEGERKVLATVSVGEFARIGLTDFDGAVFAGQGGRRAEVTGDAGEGTLGRGRDVAPISLGWRGEADDETIITIEEARDGELLVVGPGEGRGEIEIELGAGLNRGAELEVDRCPSRSGGSGSGIRGG